MENQGSAPRSEARRRLAVTRVNEGWKHKDVAAFLGVSIRAVGKWMAAYRGSGDDGLKGKPHPGAKPKLSARQERSVLSWLAKSPRAYGYKTELWTTRRLAEVIRKRYGVRFNPNYLAAWLTRRDHSPQRPETKAVERDNPGIARWVAEDWPRIKKRRGTSGRTSSRSTRAASSSTRWSVAPGRRGAGRRC
jgi:transposase